MQDEIVKIDMAAQLDGKKIAFFAAPEGTEQAELTVPWERLKQAGAEVELVSLQPSRIQMFDHVDRADTFPVDKTVAEADPWDYDGLVLPGGVANPDLARTKPEAVRFVRPFFEQGKPVAAVCHAPVDARRGGRGEGPDPHVLPQPADRHPQRRGHLGRPGGRDGRPARDQPQAGRPGGLLRRGHRGVRRGTAAGAEVGPSRLIELNQGFQGDTGTWRERPDEPLGVARSIRLPDRPDVAEVAVTVVDEHQRKGPGTMFLGLLAATARAAGIHRFRGDVLAENARMRRLLCRFGAASCLESPGVLEAEISLDRLKEPAASPGLTRQEVGTVR